MAFGSISQVPSPSVLKKSTGADSVGTSNEQSTQTRFDKIGVHFDSLNELILAAPDTETVTLTSYYGGWTATSDGKPQGGHKRFKTGYTNTAPSRGTAVSTSKIGGGDGTGDTTGQSVQAGLCWDADGIEWKVHYESSVYVRWFGAKGDGASGGDQDACQDAINFADDNNLSSVRFSQGVYDVTGLEFPDDINPIGDDSSFGSTFNFTSQNRWGSVIQNTTTSNPTLAWTKPQGTSHVVPAHLKITGNELQVSVVRFANAVYNGTGMYQCGVYASESGAGLGGADYCIEILNGGFDFFFNSSYTGKGEVANIRNTGARLFMNNSYNDVAGLSLIETNAASEIRLSNVYFENFRSDFVLVRHTGTAITKRPALYMDMVTNTVTPFESVWENTNSSSEFLIPNMECAGWHGQFPSYIFKDSTTTQDQEYPGTKSAWTFNTFANKTSVRKEHGTLPGGVTTVDVGGANSNYDIFFINNFPSPVRIDTINGGTQGRVITIVEQGDSTEFATTGGNISGNDGLPIYGRFRSAFSFMYMDGFWHYLTNSDGRNINGKRLPTSTTGLVSGQLWNDSGTVKVV